jgi:hypothetical protein
MKTWISNSEWLAGYDSFKNGEGIPWGNESARRGWLEAKRELEEEGKLSG